MLSTEEKKQSRTRSRMYLALVFFASVLLGWTLASSVQGKVKAESVNVQDQTTIAVQQLAIQHLTAQNKTAAGKIDWLTNKSKAVNTELLKIQAGAKSLSGKVTDLQKKLETSNKELKKVQNSLKELGLTFP